MASTGQSQIDPRRQIADVLMQRGVNTQPRTALEGIGGLAQLLMGTKMRREVADEETERLSAQAGVVRELLSGNEQAGALTKGMSDRDVAGLAPALLGNAIKPPELHEVGDHLVTSEGETVFSAPQEPKFSFQTVGVEGNPSARQRARINEATGAVEPVGPSYEVGGDSTAEAIRAAGDLLRQQDATRANAADKAEMRALRDNLRGAESALESASSVLKQVQENPRATGLGASINNALGGLVGQVPIIGESGEKMMSRALTGTDPETAARIRTEQRTQVAQQLSAITGEESGRFTEQERAIAEQTQRGLSPGASFEQVQSAAKTLMKLQVRSLMRARADMGAPPLLERNDEKSINQFGEHLMDLGFDRGDAVEMVSELLRTSPAGANPLTGGGS